MRWFKHMSNSQEDEILSELIERFGSEGYGVWWIVIEKIAQLVDEKDRTSARYSIKKWANSCGISSKKFQTIATFLSNHNRFSLEFDGEFLTIDCPNILKYRDEWSRKKNSGTKKLRSNSGETQERLLSKETDTEADTEADTDTEKDKKKESSFELQADAGASASPPATAQFAEMKSQLLSRYSEQEKETIEDCLRCLAITRKNGKVSNSIIIAQIRRWGTIEVERVMYGIGKYIDGAHYLDGKDENYLWGIMKNTTPREMNGGSGRLPARSKGVSQGVQMMGPAGTNALAACMAAKEMFPNEES